MKSFIPQGYKSALSVYDTQKAIGLFKRLFEDRLAAVLNLHRVSAPLFVRENTGMNDNLNGYERPVTFDAPYAGVDDAQVVQSLAKWKRYALQRYEFRPGKGIYTDMDAIRRDEELDNLHSIYVDQWDWEKVITAQDRTEEYLKDTVQAIVGAICDAQATILALYPQLVPMGSLKREVTFVTAQELEDKYPEMTGKERENAFTKEHGTVFIMGIGGTLKSGKKHDGRSPDYDDWSLNGDILFWDELLGCAMEVSSMGIRVDPETLDKQLKLAGCDDRRELTYHKMLLSGELPLTIGGGIGQSRLSMLILQKAHIGEVQASVWDAETTEMCRQAGVMLL